jgi:putative transposase
MIYHHIKAPSEGSIGNILKRHQLSKPRNFRRHVARTAPLADCNQPNDVWMYDFKGYFKTADGKICEPLTITDGYSRYLLKCVHMNRKRTTVSLR